MIEDQIRTLEAELREAQLTSDVAALDRLINDALLFTGPDGTLATKADDLAMHRSGALRITTHEPNDLRVQVVSDELAIVALRTRLAGVINGQTFVGVYRYTRVWAKRENVWRVVGGHVSAVGDQND